MSEAEAAAHAKPVRVFVSYAHEGEESRQNALKLVNSLRVYGVDAVLDLDRTPEQDEGWRTWARKEIDKADKVICIASESYARRWRKEEMPGVGNGAIFEASLIQQRIYESGGVNSKFRAAAFSKADLKHVPDELRDVEVFSLFETSGFTKLYAFVTDQQRYHVMPLGELQTIEPSTTPALFALRKIRPVSTTLGALIVVALVAIVVGIGYVSLTASKPDVRFRVASGPGDAAESVSGVLKLWRGRAVEVPIVKGIGSIVELPPDWDGQTVWPALMLDGQPRTPLPLMTLVKGSVMELRRPVNRVGSESQNQAPHLKTRSPAKSVVFYLRAGQIYPVNLSELVTDPDPGEHLVWDEITATRTAPPISSDFSDSDFAGSLGHLRLSEDRRKLVYHAWRQPRSDDDIFTATVVDSWGSPVQLTMVFVVSSLENRPPDAKAMNEYCAPGKTIRRDPAASDPDQPQVVLVGVTTPVPQGIGTASAEGNRIVFTARKDPPPGAVAKFQYTVRDEHGAEKTAIVSVRIPVEEPDCPDIVELTKEAGKVFDVVVIEEKFRQDYTCAINLMPEEIARQSDASSGAPKVIMSNDYTIHYAPGSDGRISDTIRFIICDRETRTPVRPCEIRVKFELP